MQIAVVVGNPKPHSRTFAVASAVAQSVAARLDGAVTMEVDLALVADEIFKWPSDEMVRLNESVASCDVLIVASPTYKATYTLSLIHISSTESSIRCAP